MARLIYSQDGPPIVFVISGESMVLGRHPDCDIRVPSASVSRRHARVTRRENGDYLEDLDSGNGTFVNGRRLAKPVQLQDQDRVRLGTILLRYETADESDDLPDWDQPTLGFANDIAQQWVNIADDDAGLLTVLDSISRQDRTDWVELHAEVRFKAFLHLVQKISNCHDLPSLWEQMLECMFGLFPQAERGCILWKSGETAPPKPVAFRHRRPDRAESLRLSRTILQQVQQQRIAILSADAASDMRFDASESLAELSIRSMICAPVIDNDETFLGIIYLDTSRGKSSFSSEDLEVLTAVAAQVALAYDSTMLLQERIAHEMQANEMEIARKVQQRMLPTELPQRAGYRFQAMSEPASAVGGDFYDVIPLDIDGLCLLLGDVAGKGIPAALMMSRLTSLVEVLTEYTDEPASVAAALNRHLSRHAEQGWFATLLLGILDTTSHELHMVNAGHFAPLLKRASGEVDEWKPATAGLPLGVLPDAEFDVQVLALEPGETFVLFTDGVTEARNGDGEYYGIERLKACVAAGPQRPDELLPALIEDLRLHLAGQPLTDDVTLLIVARD